MPEETPWIKLVNSVRVRRSRDAPFFKPACLIGVVDLIDEGALDPLSMDADGIVARVNSLVQFVHAGRPDMRWQPVWHLTNDGAWIFTKDGRQIGPESFKPARKPRTLRQWRTSFDRLAVPLEMLPHWRCAIDRSDLRRAAIAMLEEGNDACKKLAIALGGNYVDGGPRNVRPN